MAEAKVWLTHYEKLIMHLIVSGDASNSSKRPGPSARVARRLISCLVGITPSASIFNDPEARPPQKAVLTETFIPAGAVTDGSIEGFSTMVGGARIDRIEVMRADDGHVTGYTIWSRTAQEAGN